jgi:hypothetical protein
LTNEVSAISEEPQSPPGVVRLGKHELIAVGFGFLALALGLLSLAACNVFDPRSDALACTLPIDCDVPRVDCDVPRVCESGFCVIPAELLPDADPAVPDADPAAPDADTTTMIDSGTPLPDADPATCNSVALLDDFADGSAAPLWTAVPATGITVSEAGGVLTLAAPTNPAVTVIAGYTSVDRAIVLTDSSFFIEIPTMVNTASNAVAVIRIGATSANKIEIQQKGGSLTVNLTINSSPMNLASLSYSATEHRWWRVSDSAGTFRVQTSANGTQWVDRASAPTPAFFGAVGFDLQMRAFNTGPDAGSVVFDNANGGGVVPACP